MSRAVLVSTQLLAANLLGANLTGANLSGANLNRSNLAYANLCSASLNSADLRSADLTGIKDVDAKFDPQTMIGGNLGLTQKQSHDWINNRGAFITYLQPIPINPEEREIHDAIERQRQSINIKESLEERKIDLLDILRTLEKSIEHLEEFCEELKEIEALDFEEINILDTIISEFRQVHFYRREKNIIMEFQQLLELWQNGRLNHWNDKEIENEYLHWSEQIKYIDMDIKCIQWLFWV